jgi:hypothetical protein
MTVRSATVALALTSAAAILAGWHEARAAVQPDPVAPSPRPTIEPLPAPSTPPPAGSPVPAQPGDGDDGSCPSAVAGARTALKDTDRGVEITITARSDEAVKEVQRRAREMGSVRQVPATTPSGPPRECVVAYYPGSQAEIELIRRGIKVTVSALAPDNVDELRETTRARARAVAAPSLSRPARTSH